MNPAIRAAALVCTRLDEDLAGVEPGHADVPAPGPGQVLVRVRAAALNFPDVLMCQGRYQFRPDPPFVPGLDLSGEVLAVGPGVAAFAPGDAVMGGVRMGAFATHALADAAGLQPRPEGLDWAEAAAFPAATLTAWVALVRRGALQPGETLLVHGASGGVGLAAARLGRHLGARVIVTSGSADKLKALATLGFGEGLLTGPAGFREAVKAMTGGRGADVVFDPVGGDVFDESVRCTAFAGRLLVIGFMGGRAASVATNIALIKGISVIGVRAGEHGRQRPDEGREHQAAVAALATEAAMRPLIHARLPLARGAEALRMMQARGGIGKIVLDMPA